MINSKRLTNAYLCAIPVFTAAVGFYAVNAQAQTFSARGVQAIDSASGAALAGKVDSIDKTVNNVVSVSIPTVQDQLDAMNSDLTALNDSVNSLNDRTQAIENKLDDLLAAMGGNSDSESDAATSQTSNSAQAEEILREIRIARQCTVPNGGRVNYIQSGFGVFDSKNDTVLRKETIKAGTNVAEGTIIYEFSSRRMGGKMGGGSVHYKYYLCIDGKFRLIPSNETEKKK